jgi:hypothetical protein
MHAHNTGEAGKAGLGNIGRVILVGVTVSGGLWVRGELWVAGSSGFGGDTGFVGGEAGWMRPPRYVAGGEAGLMRRGVAGSEAAINSYCCSLSLVCGAAMAHRE